MVNAKEIAQLFGKDRKTITRHIQNIIKELELDDRLVCSKNEHTGSDGKKYIVNIYNLDMIIAIGYRVKSSQAIIFRQWATNVLKQFMIKGYIVNENRTLVTNENYVKLINKVETMDERLINVENTLSSKNIPTEKIFYNGEIYDAYTFLQKLFEQANNEITLIDNFIDRTILDRLVVKKQNVKVIIYTDIQKSHLLGIDINAFNKQYLTLDVKYTNHFHDRFIILDRLDLYLVGASLKDAGKKCFAITKIEDNLILQNLLNQYNL